METNDYRKILETAINNEMEAYEFYSNIAQKARDTELKSIFSELANEEMRHKLQLESLLKNESRLVRFKSGMLREITETEDLPILNSEMCFADGVALAMKKEEEAMTMYQQFAEASVDETQKNIFLQLSIMEQRHRDRLECIYTNTDYKDLW
jgi:rubrerythrin